MRQNFDNSAAGQFLERALSQLPWAGIFFRRHTVVSSSDSRERDRNARASRLRKIREGWDTPISMAETRINKAGARHRASSSDCAVADREFGGKFK